MRLLTLNIEGISPLTQSKAHTEPQIDGEDKGQHDERTFMAKLTTSPHGTVVIPAFAMKVRSSPPASSSI